LLSNLTYVKVVGQVKVFSGKMHIVAHHIHKMRSLNELIAHSIECIHASMSIRKGGEPVGTTSTNNGFTPIQTAVLSLLQTATTSIGFSVSSICKQLKQFNENDIQLVDMFFLQMIFEFFCFFLKTNFGFSLGRRTHLFNYR